MFIKLSIVLLSNSLLPIKLTDFTYYLSSKLADMAPTVSACLSRPCSGILALCGCMYTS